MNRFPSRGSITLNPKARYKNIYNDSPMQALASLLPQIIPFPAIIIQYPQARNPDTHPENYY